MELYFSCILIALTLAILYKFISSSERKLPPGPLGLPVIGNMHQLGLLPHRAFHDLALKHGPLMYLRLGRIPTLVVSSPEAATQVLKVHDLAFCSRPSVTASKKFAYGGLDMAMVPYGEHWRQVRRLCVLKLFNMKRVQSFRARREQELNILIKTICSSWSNGKPVNLCEMFVCMTNNITCQEVFGRRISDDDVCNKSEYHDLIMEMVELLGGFWIGDFFPSMEWPNSITGMQEKLERSFNSIDTFFETEIEAHKNGSRKSNKHEDFVDMLLKLQEDSNLGFPFTEDHMKAILSDIFIAGTDTAAATLEWGMAELIRNPKAMKKAQDEVRRVVGNKGKVEESDLQDLEYLRFVINETLRLHPPVPLLVPRESIEDCKVFGYEIPKNTRVFVNAWAIGRDPKAWEEPEAFMQDRFEGSAITYKGQHFQFIPFGGGRRICPGMNLGIAIVEIALANMLYHFNWESPNGIKRKDVDMTEKFGIVNHMKSLLLMAKPRENLP